MGLAEEVELLGARVYGSRSREGLYHEGSDIDVVVSYSGSLREDDFFNVLHEDGLEIAGIPVDINPISTEKTGTLEEYLENAEKYLDEKHSRMEIPETMGRQGRKQPLLFMWRNVRSSLCWGNTMSGWKRCRKLWNCMRKFRQNG